MSFIAGLIIDTALLIKIKSAVRVTNLYNLYKSVGVVNYFFVCFLIKLFHNVFTFTPDNSGIKYFLLVMAFIVIEKLGRRLLVTISFYMHSERWPTITLTSRDSFLFFTYFLYIPWTILLLSIQASLWIQYHLVSHTEPICNIHCCYWNWLFLLQRCKLTILPGYHS